MTESLQPKWPHKRAIDSLSFLICIMETEFFSLWEKNKKRRRRKESVIRNIKFSNTSGSKRKSSSQEQAYVSSIASSFHHFFSLEERKVNVAPMMKARESLQEPGRPRLPTGPRACHSGTGVPQRKAKQRLEKLIWLWTDSCVDKMHRRFASASGPDVAEAARLCGLGRFGTVWASCSGQAWAGLRS